jgi:hypothetical protein
MMKVIPEIHCVLLIRDLSFYQHRQVCQWLVAGRWFSPDTPVSSTNKTDHQRTYNWNIVESGVKHHKHTQHRQSRNLYHTEY